MISESVDVTWMLTVLVWLIVAFVPAVVVAWRALNYLKDANALLNAIHIAQRELLKHMDSGLAQQQSMQNRLERHTEKADEGRERLFVHITDDERMQRELVASLARLHEGQKK